MNYLYDTLFEFWVYESEYCKKKSEYFIWDRNYKEELVYSDSFLDLYFSPAYDKYLCIVQKDVNVNLLWARRYRLSLSDTLKVEELILQMQSFLRIGYLFKADETIKKIHDIAIKSLVAYIDTEQ